MIVVAVGKQSNGAVFQLTSGTEALLEAHVSDWSPIPNSVLISHDRPWDFGCMDDPMWTQIVMLLTRLNEQKIEELGGFTFLDPVSKETFKESRAIGTERQNHKNRDQRDSKDSRDKEAVPGVP